MAQVSGGAEKAAQGTGELAAGLQQLSSGANQLSNGTSRFADGLAKGQSQVPSYSEQDQARLLTVVATPVTVAGSGDSVTASTALLLALALWVGALVSFLMIRPIPHGVVSSSLTTGRMVWNTLAPALLSGVVTAVLLTVVASVVLRPGAWAMLGLAGFLLFASVIFTLANHALVALLGWAGRAVSTLLASATLAWGLSGALPGWVDGLAQMSVVTPVVEGTRIIAGAGGAITSVMAMLVAWGVISLAISLIAIGRRRQVRPGQLGALQLRSRG